MNAAHMRFNALIATMPTIPSDFDADGNVTDEAALRAGKWAWEQLTKAERFEMEDKMREERAIELLDELVEKGEAERFIDEAGRRCIMIFKIMDQMVAEGKAEKYLNEAGKTRYKLL